MSPERESSQARWERNSADVTLEDTQDTATAFQDETQTSERQQKLLCRSEADRGP